MGELAFWSGLIKDTVEKLIHSATKTELVLILVALALAYILQLVIRKIASKSMSELRTGIDGLHIEIKANQNELKRINGSVAAALSGLASHERDDSVVFGSINGRLDDLHTDVREIRDRVWNYPGKETTG